MKNTRNLLAIALFTILFASCGKTTAQNEKVVSADPTKFTCLKTGEIEGIFYLFTPDGKYFVHELNHDSIVIRDVSTLTKIKTLKVDCNDCFIISLSKDGKYFIASKDVWKLSIYDVNSGKKITTLQGEAKDVAWSPDGKYLAGFFDDDESIAIWDNTGKIIKTFRDVSLDESTVSVLWSPDGKYLAFESTRSGGIEKVVINDWGTELEIEQEKIVSSVVILDVSNGNKIKEFNVKDCNGLFWSENGKYLKCSDDDLVVVWDINSGKEIKTIKLNHDNWDCTKFSPDGKYLSTSGKVDGSIIIFDLDSGEKIKTLQTNLKYAYHEWSPDGKYILARSLDLEDTIRRIQIWGIK